MEGYLRFLLFTLFYCQLFCLGYLSTRQEEYTKEFARAERPLQVINGVLARMVDRNHAYIDKHVDAYPTPSNESIRNAARKYSGRIQTVHTGQLQDSIVNLAKQFMPDSVRIIEEKAQKIDAIAQLPDVQSKHQAVYKKLKTQLDTCQRRISEVWLTQCLGDLIYQDYVLFDTMMLGVSTTSGVLRTGNTWKGSVQFWHGSKNANNVSISLNGREVKSEGSTAAGIFRAQTNIKNLELSYSIKNPLTGEVKSYRVRQPMPITE